MKKKLNTDAMVNELRGASLFFPAEKPVPDGMPESARVSAPPPPDPLEHPSISAEPPRSQATSTRKERATPSGADSPPLPHALAEPVFDLAHEADKTNTYSFSKDELWAINDMAQELERQFDIKVTRYNLVRLAVHCLIEDFRRDKEKSFAFQRLRYPKR